MSNVSISKLIPSLNQAESQSESDAMMMMCGENDNSAVNKSMKNRNIECQAYPQYSLGFLLQGDNNILKLEKILTLFGGCQESLDYFTSLWNLTTTNENVMSDNRESHVKHNCDPRDERKRQYIKDWEPSVTVCPVGFGDERGGVRDEFSCVGVDDDGGGGDGDIDSPAESYAAKQTVLDPVEDGFLRQGNKGRLGGLAEQGDVQRFPCGVHGCGKVLFSLANYESHYHHCHSYVCETCRRVFVSNFLLDIHLQENHDSYFAVLSPRIDMFRCLVESCQQKFRTPALRKDHLVLVHKFPSSFSFHQPVKSNRSNQTSSKTVELENRRGSAMDVEAEATSSTREENNPQRCGGNNSSSQRKRVPPSICFGRGSQRAFQHRRGRGGGGNGKGCNWFEQNNGFGARGNAQSAADTAVDIESVDMK